MSWKSLRDFFALRATITVEDIEIGYGTILLLIGLGAWGLYSLNW